MYACLQAFYTVHGEDALFVARRFCNTTAVVKYLGKVGGRARRPEQIVKVFVLVRQAGYVSDAYTTVPNKFY